MNGWIQGGWCKGAAAVLLAAALSPAWAAKSAQVAQPLALDGVLPAAQRPYAQAEIYGTAEVLQAVPEIRVMRAEIAYRSGGARAPATALQVCEAWKAALQRKAGTSATASACHTGPRSGWGPEGSTDDTARATAAVHYARSPQAITENLSVVVVVCKPGQEYDGRRHVCYWPHDNGDGGSGN